MNSVNIEFEFVLIPYPLYCLYMRLAIRTTLLMLFLGLWACWVGLTTPQVDTDGNHGPFLHEQLAHLHTGNTQKKVSNIASDEDIMENSHIFAMLWN